MRFAAHFIDEASYRPMHHVSAFSTPLWQVIASNEPDLIQFFQWGLIPVWTKDADAADTIKLKTLNAWAETIETRPAYRLSVKDKRCLVLVDGFYEWHKQDN